MFLFKPVRFLNKKAVWRLEKSRVALCKNCVVVVLTLCGLNESMRLIVHVVGTYGEVWGLTGRFGDCVLAGWDTRLAGCNASARNKE